MQVQYPFALITTGIEGDLLAILSQVDVGFTTGQLQRMVDDRMWKRPKSLPVIRETLERLTMQGIVTKHTESTVPVYRFNADHLVAEHVAAIGRLRTLLLDRLTVATEKWGSPPVYGALFGSAARGQMRPDSDIDLLLVQRDGTDDDLWHGQIFELKASAERWTGNPCNVLAFTEAEASDPGALAVLRDVARDGLTFAGKPTWLRSGLRNLREPR